MSFLTCSGHVPGPYPERSRRQPARVGIGSRPASGSPYIRKAGCRRLPVGRPGPGARIRAGTYGMRGRRRGRPTVCGRPVRGRPGRGRFRLCRILGKRGPAARERAATGPEPGLEYGRGSPRKRGVPGAENRRAGLTGQAGPALRKGPVIGAFSGLSGLIRSIFHILCFVSYVLCLMFYEETGREKSTVFGGCRESA